MGGDIVLYASINKGEMQMQPVLAAVETSGAQLLFFPLFELEGNILLLQAREIQGLDKTVLMSDGALTQSSFLDAVKKKGKECILSARRFLKTRPLMNWLNNTRKNLHGLRASIIS
jgi:hypothetical protein